MTRGDFKTGVKQNSRNILHKTYQFDFFLAGMMTHPSMDPGPDVIQVVLTPRHFLSPPLSMQNQQHLQQTSTNIHTSYVVSQNENGVRSINTLSSKPPYMFTSSSVGNSTQIQTYQLRELVREKLLAEGIQLSAPPYTIPTVRKNM